MINFYWSIVALQCCVSFYCTTKWISYTYTYIPSFFGFPSHLGHHSALSRVPVLYSMFSLVVYFIHSVNSVYVSNPISQFLPSPPLSPLVSIHLFSTSLFLLCKYDNLYNFSRSHIYALIYDICFSLSDLLHSVWHSLGPSTSL